MTMYTLRNAVIIKAISVSGVFVQVELDVFRAIVEKIDTPLVAKSYQKSFFSGTYRYLTNYKGLCFWTEVEKPLQFEKPIELVETEQMAIPGF